MRENMRMLELAVVGATLTVSMASGVALAAFSSGGSPGSDVKEYKTVHGGQICHSFSDERLDVSCGTTAFGDIRFNCTTGALGRCPRTNSVTVRNESRTPLDVTVISGSREGDRNEATQPVLPPRSETTLMPRGADEYLFDIVVRSVHPGVGSIKVVDVA
jgi:hypothetical protein